MTGPTEPSDTYVFLTKRDLEKLIKKAIEKVIGDDNEQALKTLIGDDNERALDIYKFHQERVETIRTRLWTILAWLALAQGAVLGFVVKEFKFQFWSGGGEHITIEQPVPVLLLAIFGLLLAWYMLLIIDDGTKHIESNWRRVDIALKMPKPHEVVKSDVERRRNHLFCICMATIAHCIIIAQAALMILAFLAIVDSFGNRFDIPFISAKPTQPDTSSQSRTPATSGRGQKSR